MDRSQISDRCGICLQTRGFGTLQYCRAQITDRTGALPPPLVLPPVACALVAEQGVSTAFQGWVLTCFSSSLFPVVFVLLFFVGQVEALSNVTVTAVACGAFHSLAVTSSGRLYEWGLVHTEQDSKDEVQRQKA